MASDVGRATSKAEAELWIELEAESGFQHESYHQITLDQWSAINAVLNGSTPSSAAREITPRPLAKEMAAELWRQFRDRRQGMAADEERAEFEEMIAAFIERNAPSSSIAASRETILAEAVDYALARLDENDTLASDLRDFLKQAEQAKAPHSAIEDVNPEECNTMNDWDDRQ